MQALLHIINKTSLFTVDGSQTTLIMIATCAAHDLSLPWLLKMRSCSYSIYMKNVFVAVRSLSVVSCKFLVIFWKVELLASNSVFGSYFLLRSSNCSSCSSGLDLEELHGQATGNAFCNRWALLLRPSPLSYMFVQKWLWLSQGCFNKNALRFTVHQASGRKLLIRPVNFSDDVARHFDGTFSSAEHHQIWSTIQTVIFACIYLTDFRFVPPSALPVNRSSGLSSPCLWSSRLP